MAFVGEMGFDVYAVLHPGPGQEPAEILPGQVLRISPDGAVGVASTGPVMFPNGIVASPATGRVVVAQSIALALSEFERDDAGALTLVQTAELGFAPDGIAADAEGAIWVADPAGTRAVRVTPEGTVLQVVDTHQP